MNHWLMGPLLLPLVAAMVNLMLSHKRIQPQRLVSLTALGGVLIITCGLLFSVVEGTEVYRLGDWSAPFGIVLVLDRLGALFLLNTALLAFLSLLQAVRGDDRIGPFFHVFYPLQLLGINGAFLTGDLFNLFVFFEIMLIASYCLALHGGGGQRVRAGLHYVVLNLIGSALFLLALGTLYAVLGTLNMADMAVKVGQLGGEDTFLVQAGCLLLVVVFGLKAAIVPVHGWLAPLYGAVIPPVAALFAVMTKVGIYAILRMTTLIFPAQSPVGAVLAELFPLLALATLVGGVLALFAADGLPSLVSGLVILSIGTLLVGIGTLNPQGLSGALYYLVHTTLVSGGLYLLSAYLVPAPGSGGQGPRRQGTSAEKNILGGLFVVGAVASAGLPPLSGFLGKLLLLQAVDPVAGWWLWVMVLVGGLAALVSLSRMGIRLFWGRGPALAGTALLSRDRLLPAALLLAASLVMTLAAPQISAYTRATAQEVLAPERYIQAVLRGEGENL